MADWFIAKFSRFCDTDKVSEREDILAEVKIKTSNLQRNDAQEIIRNLDLTKLFSLLTSTDKLLLEQVCELLKIISQALEAGQILWRYPEEMFQQLSNPDPTVSIFVLSEILRASAAPQVLSELLTKLDLLNKVVELVGNDNLSVAKCSMDILKSIGKTDNGLKTLYTGVLLRSIAKMLSYNETVKFRVYEVIIDVAKSSPEAFEYSEKSGFLQSLISVLESDDILLQLNALEAITDLAVTQYGLNYLEQQGILESLAQKIAQAKEIPLSNLLIPGLMKFFGNVARVCPHEIFSRYPTVISALFEVLMEDDQTILINALDTLGHLASTVKGKYALQDLGNSMEMALKRLNEIIQKMPTNLRICSLNNLSIILYIKQSEQDNRILTLTKNWFDALCDEPFKMILSLCKQPFADIRQASLEVLSVLASQIWGQEYIAKAPGAIEFLLDRNIESFKECKEMKFSVVKNLSSSDSNIFDTETMTKFRDFVKEGPYYVETPTEVAIEGRT